MLTAAFLFITSPAVAQKDGSTSMQYLKVIPSARAAAMGNAYVALADGVEGLFWNPAGIALTENHDITSTYINWIFDAKQYAVGYSVSLGNYGAVGVQLQYIDYGEFEESVWGYGFSSGNTDRYGDLTGRTFNSYSYLVGLSYAKKLTDHFSTGLSVSWSRYQT